MIPLNKRLLLENKAWAKEKLNEDPEFFSRLAMGQKPKVLWIGCSDSRIPANEITNTEPGDVFVHRNIANQIIADDQNLLSVIQYAVGALGIQNIIICGHTQCGGVKASLDLTGIEPPLKSWLQPLAHFAKEKRTELDACSNQSDKEYHLTRLNVLKQVDHLAQIPFVVNCWKSGKPLALYGWIFNIQTGTLEEVAAVDGSPRMVSTEHPRDIQI